MNNKNKKTWVTELSKTHYTFGFFFNLVCFAIIYKLFGWEWFWVVAIADLSRDIGTIIKKLYEPKQHPDLLIR